MIELRENLSDQNEDKDQEPHIVTAAEVLAAENIQEAVNRAKEFCQNLEIHHDKWPGVAHDHSREAQVRKSGRKLAGFYPAIEGIDQRRWDNFYERSTKIPENNVLEFKNILMQVLDESYENDSKRWDSEAAQEMNRFLRYLNEIWQVNVNGWSSVKLEEFTYERISTIVAEFLTKIVGSGDHRVSDDVSRRTGFDGETMTCPIPRSIGKGVTYFAYLCAEYVLMQAIGEKFQILRSTNLNSTLNEQN